MKFNSEDIKKNIDNSVKRSIDTPANIKLHLFHVYCVSI